ncbi:MAG: elongation factor Ts, partial [Patescibacteria group bacterium]
MTNIKQIKNLREKTGVSVAECRRALEAAAGDENRALDWLKTTSAKMADKKNSRTLGAGAVASYIHSNGTLGALVELRSETDFVSKNQAFRNLADELAMQVAATAPTTAE